ncbi:MAG: transglycosylase domain-containing protein [Oligoflexia bacterium]|nr:transglycosylase domain-containing protein [Oligoflexia bacterium]
MIQFRNFLKGMAGYSIAAISIAGILLLGVMALFLLVPDVRDMKKCMTTSMRKVYLCESSPNFVSLKDISPYVIGAVIMSEDSAFYSHEGLDYKEIKESLIHDLEQGRFARGASTITQQLAKNVFLNEKKSLFRKGLEVYLALQIEKHFTKGQILTYYLNVVEFDEGVFGVKAASAHYFGKFPSELTAEQGAFLAFLLPNPKKYSQSFRRKQLTPFARKTITAILRKMTLTKKISELEFGEALARLDLFPWDSNAPALLQTLKPGTVEASEESTEGDAFRFELDEEVQKEIETETPKATPAIEPEVAAPPVEPINTPADVESEPPPSL